MDAVVVGIDVSKGSLDVHVLPGGESFAVPRGATGLDQLADRLAALSPRAVAVEATGGLEAVVVAALGDDHGDDLAAPRDQGAEQPGGRVGQRPDRGRGRRREAGDDGRVDRVGLGPPPQRAGEGADLGGVHDDRRQPGRPERRDDHRLEAAGGLDGHRPRRERGKPIGEFVQARGVVRHRETLAAREHMDIEAALRHGDADHRVHPVPSLHNRAPRAAHATVRGGWKGGR